jgi:hypothetical protein
LKFLLLLLSQLPLLNPFCKNCVNGDGESFSTKQNKTQ